MGRPTQDACKTPLESPESMLKRPQEVLKSAGALLGDERLSALLYSAERVLASWCFLPCIKRRTSGNAMRLFGKFCSGLLVLGSSAAN